MNAWLIAAAVLLLGGLVPLMVAGALTDAIGAAVTLNLAGPIASIIVLLLAEGFHRQPFADLALVLAVISFAGSVLVAHFLEWDI